MWIDTEFHMDLGGLCHRTENHFVEIHICIYVSHAYLLKFVLNIDLVCKKYNKPILAFVYNPRLSESRYLDFEIVLVSANRVIPGGHLHRT